MLGRKPKTSTSKVLWFIKMIFFLLFRGQGSLLRVRCPLIGDFLYAFPKLLLELQGGQFNMTVLFCSLVNRSESDVGYVH